MSFVEHLRERRVRICLATALLTILASQLRPAYGELLYYDTFDYPSTPGTQKLSGKTNAEYGETWARATLSGGNPSPDNVNIMTGNLTMPRFSPPDPSSNSALVLRGTSAIGVNGIIRVDIPDRPHTDGSLFFSMLIRLNGWVNVTGAGFTDPVKNGGWLAGFHSGTGTGGAATPGGYAYELKTLRMFDPSLPPTTNQPQRYHLGVIKTGASGETGSPPRAWDLTQSFAPGETVFVVGEYQFNTSSTTDDVARLWINPTPNNPNQYGSPDVVSPINTNDVSPAQIQSFYFAANTHNPSNFQVDELRIGTSFADVVRVPEPGTISLLIVAALTWCTRPRPRR